MQSTTETPIGAGGGLATGGQPDHEWLSTTEAATYAGGIGVSTIREACNRNALRHVRIGGGTRGPIRTRRSG